MLAYIPRISLGILKNFAVNTPLTDWHTQTFRALPLLDSDDFSILAASKYIEFSSIAGWTHGYMSGFLKIGIVEKWFVVNRRSYIDFYAPIKVLKPFQVKTKLIAYDKYSTIRLVEFYQSNKLCAQTFMQHVVVDKFLKKIHTEEWVAKTNHHLNQFGPYPEECLSWKYEDTSPETKKSFRKAPLFPSSFLESPSLK